MGSSRNSRTGWASRDSRVPVPREQRPTALDGNPTPPLAGSEPILRNRLATLCHLVIVCWLIVPSTASAISIDIDFQPGNSSNPSYDPNATGLIRLFDFAADYYGGIFEDTHDITINVWYEDIDDACDDCDSNTLGLHNLENQGGNPNRETEANIRIDRDQTWFIDPTPDDNDEFAMEQTLWQDLTIGEQLNLYTPDFILNYIPSTFELDYHGFAIEDGPAEHRVDMLTTVLHEVGHALGLASNNNSTVAETNDGDYDFDPHFVFGRSLSAKVADGDDGRDIAHLGGADPDASFALMNPSSAPGLRMLPSHTDLFSMASANDYTELDVPRREFYGGSDWNDDSNWSGNREPHLNDEVFVRDSATANLSETGLSGELHVLDDATLNLGSHNLTADGNISVDSDARIILAGGTLRATSGGRLRIGRDGEGLLVQHSGDVRLANNLTLGENVGSHGAYRLNGGTLLVSSNSPIEVGRSGDGELFQFGGTVDAALMYVGRFADSDGLFRNLGGLTRIQGAIEIGRAGTGTMRVQTDSDVASISGTIGVNSDSTGGVTVTGDGARWTNSGHLTVGNYGDGTLDISDGGVVSSGSGSIGDRGGSDGVATVTDALSSWEVDGDLSIGINGKGKLVIENGGSVTNFSGFMGYGDSGHGTVTVRGVDSQWIADHLYVGGGVTQRGGTATVNIEDDGRVVVDSLKTWSSGTVNLNSGQLTAPYMDVEEGSFNMTGGRLSPRTVFGSVTNAGGTLAPLGDSAGHAIVNGNYAQQPTATLEIGIGGAVFASYDQFDVEGIANIGGTLKLSLLADFRPGASDTFAILTASSLFGTFSNAISGARLSTIDGIGSFVVSYGPTSIFNHNEVVLSNFIQVLAGDFDVDGTVDGGDFLAWQRGGSPTPLSSTDLNDWKANYGTVPDSLAVASNVPEPQMLYFWTAALALEHRRYIRS